MPQPVLESARCMCKVFDPMIGVIQCCMILMIIVCSEFAFDLSELMDVVDDYRIIPCGSTN